MILKILKYIQIAKLSGLLDHLNCKSNDCFFMKCNTGLKRVNWIFSKILELTFLSIVRVHLPKPLERKLARFYHEIRKWNNWTDKYVSHGLFHGLRHLVKFSSSQWLGSDDWSCPMVIIPKLAIGYYSDWWKNSVLISVDTKKPHYCSWVHSNLQTKRVI